MSLKPLLRGVEVRALEGIGKTEYFDRLRRGEYESIGTGRARRITQESIERRRTRMLQKPAEAITS
jgi:hypothetical protein